MVLTGAHSRNISRRRRHYFTIANLTQFRFPNDGKVTISLSMNTFRFSLALQLFSSSVVN